MPDTFAAVDRYGKISTKKAAKEFCNDWRTIFHSVKPTVVETEKKTGEQI
jgi:hypothetical protein